jgi:beta-alanine--pyruvate transaminase
MTSTADTEALLRNDLDAYWMPFTANRAFKQSPRLLAYAEEMHYFSPEGRAIIDGSAGVWCANAGHCRASIVEAIRAQAGELLFPPPFQFGHPKAFALASRIAALAPGDLDHVFFTNSGSEAVDTALKIAIAYHNLRGEGARQRLVGRERGFHGSGFGGMAVGGVGANRKLFGAFFAGVDHLPSTYDRAKQAFTKGEPEWGAHRADELEKIVGLHDASTIAAVIVEPMAGSTGVLPPPTGYLERLRSICDKYDILLIFDEVTCAFGRLGHAFAAERYGVLPDMITFAKGVTSGTVPLGGVIVREPIYETFMEGPEHAVELLHGYTSSGHPLACAAGLAALDLYGREDLFARALQLEPVWADAVHGLKGLPSPRHPQRGAQRGNRPRGQARRPGEARVRRDGSRIPRFRPSPAQCWRHAYSNAAADRQRGADRRDRRKNRVGDQGRRLKLDGSKNLAKFEHF